MTLIETAAVSGGTMLDFAVRQAPDVSGETRGDRGKVNLVGTVAVLMAAALIGSPVVVLAWHRFDR